MIRLRHLHCRRHRLQHHHHRLYRVHWPYLPTLGRTPVATERAVRVSIVEDPLVVVVAAAVTPVILIAFEHLPVDGARWGVARGGALCFVASTATSICRASVILTSIYFDLSPKTAVPDFGSNAHSG